MAKLRAALILMIVLVACVSYRKHSHQTAALLDAATRAVDNDQAGTVSAMTTSPIDGRLMPASQARVVDIHNQEIMRECLAKDTALPRVNFSDRQTLENVMEDLGTHPDATIMNIHVRRSGGKEERIHITPHENGVRNAFTLGDQDLRVFDVDSEGLPVAKPFPRILKQDTIKHVVDAFVGSDPISFKERRSHQTFAGGVGTTVETDGHVTEMQLIFGSTTLGCAWQKTALTCACL